MNGSKCYHYNLSCEEGFRTEKKVIQNKKVTLYVKKDYGIWIIKN